MPLYEYQCEACGKRFEVIRKFSDPPLETCALCGKGPVQRLFSSPAIQFKGSGWYITDYAQKGKSSATESASGKSDGKASESKGDEKKGDEKKSDTKKSDAGGSASAASSSSTKSSAPD
jgi:putative FmdB family regulatory protein